MASNREGVKVSIRSRPMIKRESGCDSQWDVDTHQVRLKLNKQKSYIYDRVFSDDETTNDVYEEIAEPIIQSAMKGFNGTVFAYGQTSSGKTYTMMGSRSNPGIIPLAVNEIFSMIQKTPEREFLLRVSYLEIYNENLKDLLASEVVPLSIREDEFKTVIVHGLVEEMVTSPDDVLALMEKGEKQRQMASTNMNERSSRSHTIFRMIIESRERGDLNRTQEEAEMAVKVSHLNLVDLAGSERASQTGAEGQRLKEGCYINKSLMILGQVINQICKESESGPGTVFKSFRDSKLTRILQSSLGGNSLTAIICTVTLAVVDETESTLRFASSAKKITNKPIVNEVLSDEALLIRQKREINKLKRKIEEMERQKGQLGVDDLLAEKELLQDKNLKLTRMLLVSSLPPDYSKKQQKMRRETWCPGARGNNLQVGWHATPPKTDMINNETLLADFSVNQSTFISDLEVDERSRLFETPQIQASKRHNNNTDSKPVTVGKKMRFNESSIKPRDNGEALAEKLQQAEKALDDVKLSKEIIEQERNELLEKVAELEVDLEDFKNGDCQISSVGDKDELKLEINQLKGQIKLQESAISEYLSDQDLHEEEKSKLRLKISKLSDQVVELERREIARSDTDSYVKGLKGHIDDLECQLRNACHEKRCLQEQYDDETDRTYNLSLSVEKLNDELGKVRSDADIKLVEYKEKMHLMQTQLEASLSATKSPDYSAKFESEIAGLKMELNIRDEKIVDLQNTLDVLNCDLKNSEETIKDLHETLQNIKNSPQDSVFGDAPQTSFLDEKTKCLEEAIQHCEQLIAEKCTLESQYKNIVNQCSEKEKNIESLKQRTLSQQSKIDELLEQAEFDQNEKQVLFEEEKIWTEKVQKLEEEIKKLAENKIVDKPQTDPEHEVEKLKRQIEDLERSSNDAQVLYQDTNHKLSTALSEITTLKECKEKLEKELELKQSDLDSYMSMLEISKPSSHHAPMQRSFIDQHEADEAAVDVENQFSSEQALKTNAVTEGPENKDRDLEQLKEAHISEIQKISANYETRINEINLELNEVKEELLQIRSQQGKDSPHNKDFVAKVEELTTQLQDSKSEVDHLKVKLQEIEERSTRDIEDHKNAKQTLHNELTEKIEEQHVIIQKLEEELEAEKKSSVHFQELDTTNKNMLEDMTAVKESQLEEINDLKIQLKHEQERLSKLHEEMTATHVSVGDDVNKEDGDIREELTSCRKKILDLCAENTKLQERAEHQQGALLADRNKELGIEKQLHIADQLAKDTIESFANERNVANKEIEKLQKQLDDTQKLLAKASAEKDIIQHQLEKQLQVCNDLKQEINDIEKEGRHSQSSFFMHGSGGDQKLEAKVKRLTQNLDLTKQSMWKLEQTNKELTDEKRSLEQDLHQLRVRQSDSEKLQKSLNTATDQITFLQNELEKQKLLYQDAGERSMKQKKETDALLGAKEKEICEMKDKKHSLEQDLNKLQVVQSDSEKLQKGLNEATDQIVLLQKELEKQQLLYKDAEERSEKQINDLNALMEAKAKEICESKDEKHNLEQNLHQLKADNEKLYKSLTEVTEQITLLEKEVEKQKMLCQDAGERSEKEIKELDALLQAKEKEICEMKDEKHNLEQDPHQLQISQTDDETLQEKFTEASDKITFLQNELERQKLLYQDAEEKSEKQKKELDALIIAKEKEMFEVQDGKHSLKHELHQLQASQPDSDKLIESLHEANNQTSFLQNELERSEKQKVELEALLEAKEKEICETKGNLEVVQSELQSLQRIDHEEDGYQQQLCAAAKQTETLRCELQELQMSMNARKEEQMRLLEGQEHLDEAQQNFVRLYHEFTQLTDTLEEVKIQNQELTNSLKEQQLKLEESEKCKNAFQVDVESLNEKLAENLEQIYINQQKLTEECKNNQFLSENLLALQSENKDLCVTLENMKNEFANLKASLVDGNTEKHVCSTSEETQNDNAFNEKVDELGKMQDLILELKGKLSESDEAKETMTLKLSTLQTENLQLHDEIEKMVNLKTEPETKNEAFNCISEGIQQSSPSPDHDSLKQEMENLEIQNRELKSHLESVVPLSAVKLLHESLAELKTENEELKILVLDQKDQMHSKCAQLQDGVKIFAEQFENQQKTILKDEDVKIEMNVYEDMNTQYMDLKLKYDTKLDELRANVAKTEELQMTISTMEAQILSSEDIIKSLQAQLSAANEEISYSTELKSTISTFQEKITNNEEIIDSLQKELRAANEQTRIISEEAAISNTKSEQDLSNLQTEVSELKSKIETLIEQHATSLDELTERNAMLQTEVEHTIQTKETLAQENEAKSTLAEELSESLTTLKKQVEGFEAELKKSEEQLKTQSASSEKEIQYLNEVLASEKKLLDEKNIELENTANLLKEALEKMDKIETNEPASIHGGEDDHKACKSKILDLQDLLDVSDLDLRRSRSDQEHLAQLLKEHENEIKDLQMAKDDSEAQLKDAASIKDLLLKKEAELSDFILDKSQLEENVKSLKSEIDLLNSELKTESAEKLDLEVQVQDLKRCISEDKTPLIEALNAQKDLSETEKNFFVLYQEFTALTEKCSTLESAVISSKDDEEKLKTTITQQETQLNELKHDLEIMIQQKIEIETAKSCHDNEKLDLEKLQTELQALRESCHTADSNLKIESEKVARLEEECRVKEEAVSTLEEKMQTEIIMLNEKISCNEVETKQKEERLCVMQSELNQLKQDNAEIASVKLTLEKNIVKLKEQHSFDLKQKEEVSLKLCEELEEMKSQVSHSAHVEQLQNEVQCLKEKMESDLDKADTEKKQLVDCIEQLKAVISEKETKVEQFDRRLELQKSEFLLEIDEANKASKRETNHFIEMANLKEEKLQIEFQHNSQELLKCQNNLEAKTCECISLNEKITEIEETLKKKDILLSKMQESDITKQKDDESKQKFKDLQVKYNKLNLEYLQVCKEVDQFEAETAKLKQQVHTHANMEDLLKKSQELDRLQTEYKELEQKMQSLERKYAKRHLDYLEVCKEVDNLETENEKFKTMGRHTRSKSSESEPAKDLEEALAENTVLHRKFTKWRTDYMEVCKEVDQLEAENDGFKKSQKQDQAELKKLQLEVKTLNELMPLLPASQIRLINQREVDLETKQEKIQELEKSVKRQSVAIEENDKLKIAIQSRDMDIKILKGKIQQLQKSLAQLKTVQPKQRKESENLLEETQLNQQQQVTATGGQPTRRVTRSAVLPGGIVQRTKLDLQEKEMNILRNKMEHLEKELAKYKAIEVTRRGENQNLLDKNKSLRSYLSKLQHEHGKRSSQNSVISGLDVAIQTDNGTPTDQTDESPAQCKNQ